MLEFELLPRANEDLNDIIAYIVRHYGDPAGERYARTIRDVIERLQHLPAFGTAVPGNIADLRSALAGRHRIYYQPTETAILVVRILHQSMLPQQHLTEDD